MNARLGKVSGRFFQRTLFSEWKRLFWFIFNHCDMILLCRYPPIVMDALQLANAPDIPCVVYERQGLDQTSRESNSSQQSGNIMDWKEAVSKASPHDCVDVEANDPLYILYTSGTTGIWPRQAFLTRGSIFDFSCIICPLRWSKRYPTPHGRARSGQPLDNESLIRNGVKTSKNESIDLEVFIF